MFCTALIVFPTIANTRLSTSMPAEKSLYYTHSSVASVVTANADENGENDMMRSFISWSSGLWHYASLYGVITQKTMTRSFIAVEP